MRMRKPGEHFALPADIIVLHGRFGFLALASGCAGMEESCYLINSASILMGSGPRKAELLSA